VSNALKHAFPAGRQGEICVTLGADETRQVTLQVSDNGVGFPAGVDFHNTPSMGLQLVRTLTRQLQGTIRLDTTGGTTFHLSFPAA